VTALAFRRHDLTPTLRTASTLDARSSPRESAERRRRLA
jgi:hypothetical protein